MKKGFRGRSGYFTRSISFGSMASVRSSENVKRSARVDLPVSRDVAAAILWPSEELREFVLDIPFEKRAQYCAEMIGVWSDYILDLYNLRSAAGIIRIEGGEILGHVTVQAETPEQAIRELDRVVAQLRVRLEGVDS